MLVQYIYCEIIFNIFVSAIYGKLLADIKRCKAGDQECLVNTINEVIAAKYAGDPELNLSSIDPMVIREMKVTIPKDSPINIDLVIRNAEVLGLKNFRAVNVCGFGTNPEGKHEIYFKGPSAAFLGDYIASGKIFSFVVEGDGRSNITVADTDLHFVISARSTMKDGAVYMDIKNLVLNLETIKAYFHFTNIVKGARSYQTK